MSERQRVNIEVELWQGASGKWRWVMIARPDPMERGVTLWNNDEFDDPHVALADADRTVAGWYGRPDPWLA